MPTPKSLRAGLALPFLILASCGTKGSGGSASSSAAPAGGRPGSPKILVDASGIHLDGKRIGEAPSEKLEGVTALLDGLSSRPLGIEASESMGEAESQTPIEVLLPADISCLAAMNTLFTAEKAHFREIALTVGDRKAPLSLARSSVDVRAASSKSLTLWFRDGGKVAVGNTDCGGAFDVQPASSIESSAKELVKGTPITGGAVLVRCDAGAKFADVLDVYLKVRPSEKSPLAGLRCEGRSATPQYLGVAGPDVPTPSSPWGRDTPGPNASSIMAPDVSSLDENSVRTGAATVTGALAKEDVLAAMAKRVEFFGRCYAGALAKNPNLQGSVSIGLEIGKSGEVMSTTNAGASLPDSAVVQCIVDQAAYVVFPASSSGVTRVTYPISFAPPEKKK